MLNQVFSQILEMSLTAGFVIFVILLARIPLRKAPKIFSYALWSVALFRLICPWSFTGSWSLLAMGQNALEQLGQYLDLGGERAAVLPSLNSNIINGENGGAEIFKDIDLTGLAQPVTLPSAASSSSLDNSFTQSVSQSLAASLSQSGLQSLIQSVAESGLAFVWLLGMVAILGFSLLKLYKLRKKLRGAVWEKENIYLTHILPTPIVLGVIKPKIYLPSFLSRGEKEYILLHEQTHIRRFDHVIKLVSFFALCIHWFNPLVWVAFFLSGKDMEMACDEAVIKKLGNGVKKDYTTSLLSLAAGRRIVGGIPLAFGEGDTRGRIQHVLNYKKPVFWVIALSLAAVTVLGVGLLADPEDQAGTAKGPNLSSEVLSILIEKMDNQEQVERVQIQDGTQIRKVIEKLNEAKKTLRSSVNDTPLAEEYYSLAFYGRESNAFRANLYEEKGKYYLELPYTGIYALSSEGAEYILGMYEKKLKERNGEEFASAQNLTFTVSDEDWQPERFGAAAFMTWLATFLGEEVSPEERLADFWFNNIRVYKGEWKDLQELPYHYVVQVNYGITTATDEYFAPADGISGKGSFDNLFRELGVKSLGNGQYEIVGVGTGGAVRDFKEVADPLETAVSRAILEHNRDNYRAGQFATEAHTILGVTEHGFGNKPSNAANGSNVYFNNVTVYAMALYTEFDFKDEVPEIVGGSHMPVAITFQVESEDHQQPGSGLNYKLLEYWEPKDGADNGPSIKERFPKNIVDDAMNTQKYVVAHSIACYEKALAYKNHDVQSMKPEIERLIKEICSSPKAASSPAAYIEAHTLEYRTLIYYGDYTLDYAFNRFAKGGETGLEGHIMAAACRDILKAKGLYLQEGTYNTGQDWYEANKAVLRH